MPCGGSQDPHPRNERDRRHLRLRQCLDTFGSSNELLLCPPPQVLRRREGVDRSIELMTTARRLIGVPD